MAKKAKKKSAPKFGKAVKNGKMADFLGYVKENDGEELVYKATLKNFGKTFEANGVSVLDAITNLQPGNVKARAILTLERDGKTRERILQPRAVQMLFNGSRMMREIQLKQVSMLFDV